MVKFENIIISIDIIEKYIEIKILIIYKSKIEMEKNKEEKHIEIDLPL